jgi:hypothetical protein
MVMITADEAYYDKYDFLYEETGVILITSPSADTKLPENVASDNFSVTLDDICNTAMLYFGSTEMDMNTKWFILYNTLYNSGNYKKTFITK